jgi:hypothetical protein
MKLSEEIKVPFSVQMVPGSNFDRTPTVLTEVSRFFAPTTKLPRQCSISSRYLLLQAIPDPVFITSFI